MATSATSSSVSPRFLTGTCCVAGRCAFPVRTIASLYRSLSCGQQCGDELAGFWRGDRQRHGEANRRPPRDWAKAVLPKRWTGHCPGNSGNSVSTTSASRDWVFICRCKSKISSKFVIKLRFHIVGVLSEAEGIGKPNIMMFKPLSSRRIQRCHPARLIIST